MVHLPNEPLCLSVSRMHERIVTLILTSITVAVTHISEQYVYMPLTEGLFPPYWDSTKGLFLQWILMHCYIKSVIAYFAKDRSVLLVNSKVQNSFPKVRRCCVKSSDQCFNIQFSVTEDEVISTSAKFYVLVLRWYVCVSIIPCVITHRYTSEKDDLMNLMLIPRFDVPELVLDAYDAFLFRKMWLNVSIVILYLI
jgi:hypothetical protein